MKINLRRVLVVSAILAHALILIVLRLRMISDQHLRTGSDSIGFYVFGRIAENKGYPNLYSLPLQKQYQEELVGFEVEPIYYTHLPFTAPLASLLVDENYAASFVRWIIVRIPKESSSGKEKRRYEILPKRTLV